MSRLLLLLGLCACGTPPLYWAGSGDDSTGSANPTCCSCVCETCTLTVECDPVCDEPCGVRCEQACNVCGSMADAEECL